MTIEAVVVKALLGPALGYAEKKAAQVLLGRSDERALIALCSQALGEALDEALAPHSPVLKGEREHLLWLLETALGEATETVEGMPTFGPTDVSRMVKHAHQSATIDWETFGVYRDNRFHKLDEVDIFTEFLIELPTRLRNAARRADSPLANLAAQLNYGELITSLNEVRQTLAMSLTVGTAGDTEDARKRALERQRSVIAARVADDLARSQYVESGLMRQWLAWSAMPPWSVRVVDALWEVVSALRRYRRRRSGLEAAAANVAQCLEAAATDAVEHPAPYSSLRLALSSAPLEEAYTMISEAALPIGGKTSIGNDIIVDRETALHRLLWLKQQVLQPEFNHSFNVAGSFGSGTSRFLTRIAQVVDRSNDLALFMTVGPGESFTNTLLRRLSETFGMDFRNIRDTDVLLTGNGEKKLYLLMEDVDQQTRDEASLNDLLDLVEASTAVPGIRWCLAANLDGLNAVLSSSRPYFWGTYSFVPKNKADAVDIAVGGWIDLDALNASTALGLRLLKDLAAEERPDLHTMLAHPEAFASEGSTFANPLPAWMRYEALAAGLDTHPVSDPQDPNFIRQYWSFLKLRHFKPDTTSRPEVEHAEVENAVRVLARQLHASGQDSVPLYTAGDINAETAPVNVEASAALRRMGLLRVSYRGDPEVEPLVLAAVPVFAPFWGYRIGQLVLADLRRSTDEDPASLVHALQSWYGRANRGEALAEAACQFTLGGLAEEGEDRDRAMWQSWERDAQAPRVPFLMAGAAASEPFSRFAVQLVTRSHYKPLTERETFVMMRLAAKVSSPGWKADQRLAVLTAQRQAIVRHGLHTYASHVTRAVLTVPDLVERENFVSTCTALMGCEETGTAELAARLMVANGLRLFESQEEFSRYAIRFLQRISKPVREPSQIRKSGAKAKARLERAKTPVLSRPGGDTFPQKFVDSLLGALVRGPDAAETVRTLARLGWWTGRRKQIHPAIAFHMGQQLNLAFGWTAHQEGPDEVYVGVVEDLLDGTLLPQATHHERFTIAMYLVKHSVPTYARWDLEVDPCLYPALRRLWNNRGFRRRERTRLEPLCEANEIPLPGSRP